MHPASCNNIPHLLLLLTLSHEHALVLCASSLLQLCSPCHMSSLTSYAQQVFCNSSHTQNTTFPLLDTCKSKKTPRSSPRTSLSQAAALAFCCRTRLRRSPSFTSTCFSVMSILLPTSHLHISCSSGSQQLHAPAGMSWCGRQQTFGSWGALPKSFLYDLSGGCTA